VSLSGVRHYCGERSVETIDPEKQVCCNSKVLDIKKGQNLCCGGVTFSAKVKHFQLFSSINFLIIRLKTRNKVVVEILLYPRKRKISIAVATVRTTWILINVVIIL
jgi:hypothetical protein